MGQRLSSTQIITTFTLTAAALTWMALTQPQVTAQSLEPYVIAMNMGSPIAYNLADEGAAVQAALTQRYACTSLMGPACSLTNDGPVIRLDGSNLLQELLEQVVAQTIQARAKDPTTSTIANNQATHTDGTGTSTVAGDRAPTTSGDTVAGSSADPHSKNHPNFQKVMKTLETLAQKTAHTKSNHPTTGHATTTTDHAHQPQQQHQHSSAGDSSTPHDPSTGDHHDVSNEYLRALEERLKETFGEAVHVEFVDMDADDLVGHELIDADGIQFGDGIHAAAGDGQRVAFSYTLNVGDLVDDHESDEHQPEDYLDRPQSQQASAKLTALVDEMFQKAAQRSKETNDNVNAEEEPKKKR